MQHLPQAHLTMIILFEVFIIPAAWAYDDIKKKYG